MSLRDQLLAKGLASKKDVRKANQQAKKKRKKDQGEKRRQSAVQAERQAAKQAAREAKQAARLEERQKLEASRDAYERALRIRNLVFGNRVTSRGDHPFFFKGPDGRTVHRMKVQRSTAQQLASGALAVVAFDLGNRVDFVLVGRNVAEKLQELDAGGLILHWASGEPDTGEGLLDRDWEPSLVPHRVRS